MYPPSTRPLTPDRTQKVKDARTEAAKEIEAYKLRKAQDFAKFEAEVSLPFFVSRG